jgi:Sedlin, N-terminal conserved region
MSASQSSLLFVIVGRNEPIFETEIHKRGTMASAVSDAMARQNYFVLHSALDLVDKAAWTSNNMYLKVVDKVNFARENCAMFCFYPVVVSHFPSLLLYQSIQIHRSTNNRYPVS